MGNDCAHCIREVTGSGYDPELFEEQQPLMDGRPPSPPRAAFDASTSKQRAHSAHNPTLPGTVRVVKLSASVAA